MRVNQRKSLWALISSLFLVSSIKSKHLTLIEGLAKAYKYLNVPLATESETNIHQIDKKQPNKAFDKIIDILGKIDTFETANNMQNSTKNEEKTIAILKYLDDKFVKIHSTSFNLEQFQNGRMIVYTRFLFVKVAA